MGKTLKNIAITTALFFVVGALLAMAAPTLAGVVGVDPSSLGHTADPLWLGSFFGAFGALDAGLRPIFDKVFRRNENKTQTRVRVEEKILKPLAPSVQPELSPAKSEPEQTKEECAADAAKRGTYCRYIETERTVTPETATRSL